MPQLDKTTFFSQTLTVCIILICLFVLLCGVILPLIYRAKKTRKFLLENPSETEITNLRVLLLGQKVQNQIIEGLNEFIDDLDSFSSEFEKNSAEIKRLNRSFDSFVFKNIKNDLSEREFTNYFSARAARFEIFKLLDQALAANSVRKF